ncbi:glutamate receptor 2-like [Branchiostoma lanceolatum]|uniref:glutamate receptor 2-like n=1 Tax=Branchiostoma lanceolatum TaxID=7740 RepID=UPI003453382B
MNELYAVADGEYGRYRDDTGAWTGMVGDVVGGTADIAVAIVSITSRRQEVGDFTLPFYANGITFAMRKSQSSKSNWGFVRPFEGTLWATILMTAVAVAIFQGVANCVTKQRDPETEEYVHPERGTLAAEAGFWGHAWESLVVLVQLSPDFLPRSLSGRIVTFFWCIGVLVATSTYTANLAAFLTVSSAESSISSPEDLLTQTEYTYGAVEPYSSYTQFQTTTAEPYHSLGLYMQANKESVLVQSVAEGLEKARAENYALFTDSAELDYAVSRRPCTLKTVGRLFWQTGFGFFLPKDSPYVVEFNRAILRAEEQGVTGELDHKWIRSQECDGSAESNLGSEVIGLQDLLGVFVLVYGGMGLGLLALVGEFIYACAQDVTRSPDKPRTLREAVAMRLWSVVSPLSNLLSPRRITSNSTNASNYADCEEGFQLQFLSQTPDVPTSQTAY